MYCVDVLCRVTHCLHIYFVQCRQRSNPEIRWKLLMHSREGRERERVSEADEEI